MDNHEEIRSVVAKTAEAGLTPDMEKINAQALRPLTEEDVFAFKIAACDTLVDRDFEHFTERALREMAPLYVGRPVLFDHVWSASKQTARIYDAAVEKIDGGHRLVLWAYMLRTDATSQMIDAILGGILREVSVGCAVRKQTCDICGKPFFSADCPHGRGREYDGVLCTVTLDGCADVYEVSFVAVPSQRAAGVTKKLEKAETEGDNPSDSSLKEGADAEIPQDELDEFLLEAVRYP